MTTATPPPTSRRGSGKTVKIIGIGIAMLVGCCGLFVVAGILSDRNKPPTTTQKPVADQPADAISTAAPPAPTMLPWEEVKFFREKATDAQWERFVQEAIIGSQVVDWPGYVYEVEEKSDGFLVKIDLDNPEEPLSVPEIHLETTTPDALGWFKGTKVRVSGTVTDANYGMGLISSIELGDATVAPQ